MEWQILLLQKLMTLSIISKHTHETEMHLKENDILYAERKVNAIEKLAREMRAIVEEEKIKQKRIGEG